MDCEAIRDQLADYVLGALDPAEAVRVAQHLAGCADCRRLAGEWADVAHQLPYALAAASPHRPAPAVKDRLLATLADTRLNPAASSAPAQPGAAAPPGRADDRAPTTPGVPAPRRTVSPASAVAVWSRWQRLRTVVAVAALLLLALSLAWSVRLNAALARERQLSANVAQLANQMQEQQETILEVVDAPGKTVKVALKSPAGTPSYGKLFTRPDLPDVVVMAGKLPPAPTGQAYHLWLTEHGQTALAGIMTTNADGFGLIVLHTDHTGPVYEAARLTLQPLDSDTPKTLSGTVVLTWDAGR